MGGPQNPLTTGKSTRGRGISPTTAKTKKQKGRSSPPGPGVSDCWGSTLPKKNVTEQNQAKPEGEKTKPTPRFWRGGNPTAYQVGGTGLTEYVNRGGEPAPGHYHQARICPTLSKERGEWAKKDPGPYPVLKREKKKQKAGQPRDTLRPSL